MFEQFSLLPWSPQGLPGTAEQILVAYIARTYIFAMYVLVSIYHIITFLKDGVLEIQVSFKFVL